MPISKIKSLLARLSESEEEKKIRQKKAANRGRIKLRVGETWSEFRLGGGESPLFQKRVYPSYEDYVELQKQKLSKKVNSIGEYDRIYRQVLKSRLEESGLDLNGKRALCLAARIGTEVKAFRDVGAFALGIDLNPGERNEYVVYGDFHALQFPDASADVVFTNSIDHAFDPQKMIAEARRVLAPDGFFILEAFAGNEGKAPGFYESFWWETAASLGEWVASQGFRQRASRRFENPWPGTAFVFQKRPESEPGK